MLGLGLALAVARRVGAARARGDEAGERRALWAALGLVVRLGVVLVPAAFLFARPLASLLTGSPEHAALIRVATLGALGVGVSAPILGYFSGRSDVKAPFLYALGGGGFAMIAVFFLVPWLDVLGASLCVAAVPFAGLATIAAVYGKRLAADRAPAGRSPGAESAEPALLLRTGVAALVYATIEQGSYLFLRAHYLHAEGPTANGLLQAAIGMSQQVGAVFTSYLAGYGFGRAASAGSASGIEAYIRRLWIPLVGAAFLAVSLAMLGATPLLHLLYSDRFDAARPLFAWTLWGEFGRIAAFALALGSLPLGGSRAWFQIAITQPITLAAGYLIGRHALPAAMAFPVAYAAAGFVNLGAAVVTMARLGVRIAPRAAWITVAAAAALGTLAIGLTR
jgi:hypothetical protein